MINKNIKSVGWFMEEGEVLDDREGIYSEFEEMFNDGSKVSSFEEGKKKVKEYVLEYGDEGDWVEVEKKLNELKKLNKGEDWIVWNVECDCSLGFKVNG
jgi:hypothetical protein